MNRPNNFINVSLTGKSNRLQSTIHKSSLNGLFDWTPIPLPNNRNVNFVSNGAVHSRYLLYVQTISNEAANIHNESTTLIDTAVENGFINRSPDNEEEDRSLQHLQLILDEALDVVDATVTGTLITQPPVASEYALSRHPTSSKVRLKRRADHGNSSDNRQ
jgi:hypothetical protein